MTTGRNKDNAPDTNGRIVARIPITGGPDADEIWRMHKIRNSMMASAAREQGPPRKRIAYRIKRRGPAKFYQATPAIED